MDETIEDVKPGEGSSPAPDEKPLASESSPEGTQQTPPNDKGPQSIADVIAGVVEKAEAADEGEEKADKSGSKIEPDEKEAPDKEVKGEATDKGPVPYERFKEINEAKSALESELAEVRDLAEAQRNTGKFLQSKGVSPKEYQAMVDLLVLSKEDPAKFVAALRGEAERLAGEVGDKLSDELQKMVDDGVVPLEVAQRLAKAEATSKLNGAKATKASELTFAERQNAFASQVKQSGEAWVAAKRKSDPDFQPKKSKDEPDGKFEAFGNKLTALLQDRVIGKLGDELSILEEAYESVSKMVSRFSPKPAASRRTMSSTRSTTAQESEPKNIREVIANVMKKHGG